MKDEVFLDTEYMQKQKLDYHTEHSHIPKFKLNTISINYRDLHQVTETVNMSYFLQKREAQLVHPCQLLVQRPAMRIESMADMV